MYIEKFRTDKYDNCRIPGIITTQKGSIILYYECRSRWSDWAEIDIAMRKSTDGGKTFSQRKILRSGGGKTVNNPVMFADSDKIVLLFVEEYRRIYMMTSLDDGETFGNLAELTGEIVSELANFTVIACGPGHGTVMKNGRYIVPFWFVNNQSDLHAHRPSDISTLYSDDHGVHWHIGEIIKDERLINPSEVALAELENGEIKLDKSIALFEEGTKLSAECAKILDDAEQKVTIVVVGKDNQSEENPFFVDEEE